MATGRPIQCLMEDGLAIGDFDQIHPPSVAPRLYRTLNGWRVFYTDRGRSRHGLLMRDLLFAGCDPRYVLQVSQHGFGARISPKQELPEPWTVAQFVHQEGSIHRDWHKFIGEHDRLTRAHNGGRLC